MIGREHLISLRAFSMFSIPYGLSHKMLDLKKENTHTHKVVFWSLAITAPLVKRSSVSQALLSGHFFLESSTLKLWRETAECICSETNTQTEHQSVWIAVRVDSEWPVQMLSAEQDYMKDSTKSKLELWGHLYASF